MKKWKRKLSAFLMLVICMVTMAAAVPVSAAVSADTKDSLAQSVPEFLQAFFVLDDDSLSQVRENGGFYEVLVDAWKDNRDIVGEFKEVKSVDIDDSDEDQVVVTAEVAFEKYNAECVLYFDSEGSEPTNFEMNIEYSFGEKMAQAGQNTAVGLITVFVMLIFLAFLISLFKFIPGSGARRSGSSKNKKEKVAAPAPSPEAAGSAEAETVPLEEAESEEELIAVIAAAVAAAEADSHSESGYVVRSIRRVGKSDKWKRV